MQFSSSPAAAALWKSKPRRKSPFTEPQPKMPLALARKGIGKLIELQKIADVALTDG
jgi:hypothetical protein